jgi:hypothetical protein
VVLGGGDDDGQWKKNINIDDGRTRNRLLAFTSLIDDGWHDVFFC